MNDIKLAAAGQTGSIFAARETSHRPKSQEPSIFSSMLDEMANKRRPFEAKQPRSLIDGLRGA